ncbi:TPA: T9SS type A sorting domain-containing protein [Candidatus Poribacteria bacterium]|nr:T9SS type A sorting domain-containing protein [Candidatus Poribacteria bacterium]HEX30042.1 T9SS type A sorting domain-containing protein [Candidatus Poribacteria bacterium]
MTVVGGLPKLEFDEDNNPYAGQKTITFQAIKENYEDSDTIQDHVVVLGDRPKGGAEQVIVIPNVNYLVLHDPPGDDSYSYIDDTGVIRGAIRSMQLSFNGNWIAMHPLIGDASWSTRSIDPAFEENEGRWLLDVYRDDDVGSAATNYRVSLGLRFGIIGGKVLVGGIGFATKSKLTTYLTGKLAGTLSQKFVKQTMGKLATGVGAAFSAISFIVNAGRQFQYANDLEERTDSAVRFMPMIQYEVRPTQRLQTPRGDKTPDMLGPGRGDVYFGEGWRLLLRDIYRFGIVWDDTQKTWNQKTEEIKAYTFEESGLATRNLYAYTVRDIEQIIADLNTGIEQLPEDSNQRKRLEEARESWQTLLEKNQAYIWDHYYVDNAAKIARLESKANRTQEEEEYLAELRSVRQEIDTKGGDALAAFLEKHWHGVKKSEMSLIAFSGGPEYSYSRTISEGHFATYSTFAYIYSRNTLGNYSEMISPPPSLVPIPVRMRIEIESGNYYFGKEDRLSNELQSGQQITQTVGFVFHDDDFGDQFVVYTSHDPVWGTPIFFQDPGSVSSDPWEPGTTKAVDVRLELVETPSDKFDYQEGAHYLLKLTYLGRRAYLGALDAEHRTLQRVNFTLFAPPPDNPDNLIVKFNGTHEPYTVGLNQDLKSATVTLSLYPPEKDRNNTAEKQYSVKIMVQEEADPQIARMLTLTPTFADLRAPRAVVVAPYDGERISPVFFPSDNPFKIEVVSEDMDIAKIQLQIRSKRPDGVWGSWYDLSGMKWEDGGDNPNVTVFDRLDRRPPRREFTFKWSKSEIESVGVGEYALRAVATDKATPNPNTDIDPPFVVFMVDDAKPSVLKTIPDYQARESKRIYRGELSVTFTDDMRATDFSDRTFYVTDLLDGGKKVSGYVSYNSALRKAVFVPVTPFKPNGYYRVEIKTDVDTDGNGEIDERGVHDLAGNPLDMTFVWTFRTTDAPFEPTWYIRWRVSDGTTVDSNNICAVEYGAEDGEDEKDVRAVPALSSQMKMCFLDRDRNEFDRDIRPADGRLAHHWFFVIDNAKPGSTVTLEYQPSVRLTKTTRQYQVLRLVEFDQQGNVSNVINLNPTQATVDPDTGEVNYVVAHQYVNQGEQSRYFRLDVQKAEYVATEWERGTSSWKFFSVPITPQRAEPFVNLGDDIDPFQMFQYDTQSGGYKVYPYDIGEVALQTGHGYFTRLSKDVEVDVGGAMNQGDVTITLQSPGWHAIGNPFIKPVKVSDLKVNGEPFDNAVNDGIVEGTLYRWRIVSKEEAYRQGQAGIPVSDGYQAVTSGDDLEPWEGYWLKTNQENVTLLIPAPANLPNRAPTPDYLKPPMAPLVTKAERQGLEDGKGDLKLALRLVTQYASDTTTTLGTHMGAEDGYDRFDMSEPPTLSKTVALYFNHPDWGERSGAYDIDIRSPMKVGESRIWHLTAYTDRADADMKLSWDESIEDVPGDIMLYFRLKGGEWQDMREVREVDLHGEGRITEIPIEIKAEKFKLTMPADIHVVGGERKVTITWSEDDNPFIEGYIIERVKLGKEEGEIRRFELSSAVHEFVDTDVEEEAAYSYRLVVRFRSGAELRSEPFTVTVLPVIEETVLLQSYPNPFNPDVWIPYELSRRSPVEILIYDSAGRLVRRLDLGIQPRGNDVSRSRAAYWEGRNEGGERVSSGVYFYTLKAGRFRATRKMVILK